MQSFLLAFTLLLLAETAHLTIPSLTWTISQGCYVAENFREMRCTLRQDRDQVCSLPAAKLPRPRVPQLPCKPCGQCGPRKTRGQRGQTQACQRSCRLVRRKLQIQEPHSLPASMKQERAEVSSLS